MVVRLRQLLNHFRRDAHAGSLPTDADLIHRFRTDRDNRPRSPSGSQSDGRGAGDAEDAFAAMVRRHGPMVFGVCRRMLANHQDAEDAFQATFLVLACKPHAVRPAARLAAWLHGVACRVALHARRAAARRRNAEARAATERPRISETLDPLPDDVRSVIDVSLAELPEKYRAALVLCDLEGLSRKEAAGRLGWSEGTLSGRLARARKLLAERLTRRGVTLGSGGIAAVLSVLPAPAVSAEQIASAINVASLAAGGMTDIAAGPIAALTREVTRSMSTTHLKLKLALAGVLLLTAGLCARSFESRGETPAPLAALPTSISAPPVLPVPIATAPIPKGPGWHEKATLKHEHAVNAVAFGPTLVFTGDAGGNVISWDVRTGKEKEKIIDPGKVKGVGGINWLGLSKDASWVHVIHKDRGAIRARKLGEDSLPGIETEKSRYLGFSPDGTLFFQSVGENREVVWFFDNQFADKKAGRAVVALELRLDKEVMLGAMVPDKTRALTVTADGKVWCWQYPEGRLFWTSETGRMSPTTILASPDGATVAVAGADGTVRFFSGENGKELARLEAHAGAVNALAFSADGKQLCTAGSDKTVQLWDMENRERVATLNGHTESVLGVAFSPDGTMIATASADKTAKVWEFKK
jgi:RNA polymerase sigma factor (sigma-70 family)